MQRVSLLVVLSVAGVFGCGATQQAVNHAATTEGGSPGASRSEIDTGTYVGGAGLGTVVGFGIGHAAQGRYAERGWMFTVGELGALGLFGVALSQCEVFGDGGDTACVLAAIGLYGAFTIRAAEIIDLWIAPPLHNRRVRRARENHRVQLYVIPTGEHSGALGLQGHF